MKIGVDYIGVSAGAVITNNKGEYFLVKRGAGARDDVGLWEFPGGAVNFNETREDATLRNISDKYCINIHLKSVLGVYDVIDKTNGDHWVSTTYLYDYVDGNPEIVHKEKCDDWGWFSLEEVKQLPLSRISKLNLSDILS